jgi:hypothetical protein
MVVIFFVLSTYLLSATGLYLKSVKLGRGQRLTREVENPKRSFIF